MVHHLWCTSKVTEAELSFPLSTPALRRAFLAWLPIIGQILLPSIRGFTICVDTEPGHAEGLRLDFDRDLEEDRCESMPFPWYVFANMGRTSAVSLHDRMAVARSSPVSGEIGQLVEDLLLDCTPRRLTVQGMETVMRETVSKLSRGAVKF